jgi:hypothetical protein
MIKQNSLQYTTFSVVFSEWGNFQIVSFCTEIISAGIKILLLQANQQSSKCREYGLRIHCIKVAISKLAYG